jgi:hypothetical protein
VLEAFSPLSLTLSSLSRGEGIGELPDLPPPGFPCILRLARAAGEADARSAAGEGQLARSADPVLEAFSPLSLTLSSLSRGEGIGQ